MDIFFLISSSSFQEASLFKLLLYWTFTNLTITHRRTLPISSTIQTRNSYIKISTSWNQFPLCEKDHAHTFSKLIHEKHHESSLIFGTRQLDRLKCQSSPKSRKIPHIYDLAFISSKSHHYFHRWNLKKDMIFNLKTLTYTFDYLHSFFCWIWEIFSLHFWMITPLNFH